MRALAQLSCGVCAGHGHAHAQKEAAAKQAAAQRDDYLRKRMLGLARGGSERPVEI